LKPHAQSWGAEMSSTPEMPATPGPWAVGYRTSDVTACDGRMKVCDIRGWGYLTGKGALGLSDEEATAIQTANARLIASAPSLYAALAGLLAASEAEAHDYPATAIVSAWEDARAALKLARGE
jgi:hypothetical protein